MAANDYYNPAPSRHGADASLPPLPPSELSPSIYKTISYRSGVSDNEVSLISPTYPDSNYIEPRPNMYKHESQQSAVPESLYSDQIPLRPRPHPISRELPDMGTYADDGLRSSDDSGRGRKQGWRKKGFFAGKVPWVVYTLTLLQVIVFIVELVKNCKFGPQHLSPLLTLPAILTKTPIEIHPQFNPMIGPSIYVLINMGARYVPCMKSVPGIQDSPQPISWPCPNTTSSDPNSPMNQCQLSDLCGFSPVPNPHFGGSLDDVPQPNQWFRFIIPIFLHAGFVHIGFNMPLQLTLGKEMEQLIGSVRFFLVYFSSGIFGFIMGGNFAPNGIASTGASGALFGIIAITMLDLFYTWKDRPSPGKDLIWIGLDVIVSFVLGLLPGLDNFSHIGGFLMGLVLGICILRSPNALRSRIGDGMEPFSPIHPKSSLPIIDNGGIHGFVKQPGSFFKDRKPMWWGWWLFRAVCLVGVIICFALLLNNFYVSRKTCSWCKYLSCLVSPFRPSLHSQ